MCVEFCYFHPVAFAITVTVGWSERSVIWGSLNIREEAFSLAYESIYGTYLGNSTTLSLSMYITIKRVRKTFDETLEITGASRSWDLSNLLNAPCPQIIPVGGGLWQRLSCTLTWAVVTPDSGHCWKGTCGVTEQQDPEVPQCPSSLDNALGHSWAFPGAVLGAASSHQLSFLSCQAPFGSRVLVQSSIYLGNCWRKWTLWRSCGCRARRGDWVILWAWFYLSASCTGI